MRKILLGTFLALILLVFCSGCGNLRFAPNQTQKQNAWLHNRTTMMASQIAQSENTSEQLKALSQLSESQSRAFTSYFGLPSEFPRAETVADLLSEHNWQLANLATVESAKRPDGWQLADNALELAIGIAALLGGVYGTKVAGFLQLAKTKSKALEEIVKGNELFKQENPESAPAFKAAQKNQSLLTRQIVEQARA
ncbi:MAG: hypothetical protein KAI59_04165 [Planctomycetes bacterium]|nr:hypothetical protein [Planctomycetota bacterium]